MISKKGFTLIELVMIIVILGILAAVAIPRYHDLQTQAQQAAEDGIVGGVRSGIALDYANTCATTGTCAWADPLDGVAASAGCDTATGCFDNILEQPIADPTWVKGATIYIYNAPDGTSYTYDPLTGSFD